MIKKKKKLNIFNLIESNQKIRSDRCRLCVVLFDDKSSGGDRRNKLETSSNKFVSLARYEQSPNILEQKKIATQTREREK